MFSSFPSLAATQRNRSLYYLRIAFISLWLIRHMLTLPPQPLSLALRHSPSIAFLFPLLSRIVSLMFSCFPSYCLSRTLSNYYSRYLAFSIICLPLSIRSVLAQMAFPLHASEISDKSETGREQHISVPAESSHFFPFKKKMTRRGQNVTFFGQDVTKTVTSYKKYFRVRERHILPRNVTNVTRQIFCYRKK